MLILFRKIEEVVHVNHCEVGREIKIYYEPDNFH